MTVPYWSLLLPHVPNFYALHVRPSILVAYLSPMPHRGGWELIVGLHRDEGRRIRRSVPDRAYGERLGLRWLSMHRGRLDQEVAAYDAQLPYHDWTGVVAGTR